MYNNYGYNPYGRYMPQQSVVPTQMSVPQPEQFNTVQSRPVLNGKMVESEEIVKSIEIPLDGSVSYFPLADGNTIITKQLQNDGTSKITIFKPVVGEKKEVKYITPEELKKAINGIDLSEIDDIKEELREIKKQLKKKSD